MIHVHSATERRETMVRVTSELYQADQKGRLLPTKIHKACADAISFEVRDYLVRHVRAEVDDRVVNGDVIDNSIQIQGRLQFPQP